MNKLTIIGNLVRDPETRMTASGISVCNFIVAVNRRKRADQEHADADYFRVTTWRNIADSCSQYLAKGRKVAVTGSVSSHTYEGRDGKMYASLEIQAEEVEFLTPRASAPNGPAAYGQHPEPPAFSAQNGFEQVDDEELPF